MPVLFRHTFGTLWPIMAGGTVPGWGLAKQDKRVQVECRKRPLSLSENKNRVRYKGFIRHGNQKYRDRYLLGDELLSPPLQLHVAERDGFQFSVADFIRFYSFHEPTLPHDTYIGGDLFRPVKVVRRHQNGGFLLTKLFD